MVYTVLLSLLFHYIIAADYGCWDHIFQISVMPVWNSQDQSDVNHLQVYS